MNRVICPHHVFEDTCSHCRFELARDAAPHRSPPAPTDFAFELKLYGLESMILTRQNAEELATLLHVWLDAEPEQRPVASEHFSIKLVRRRSRHL